MHRLSHSAFENCMEYKNLKLIRISAVDFHVLNRCRSRYFTASTHQLLIQNHPLSFFGFLFSHSFFCSLSLFLFYSYHNYYAGEYWICVHSIWCHLSFHFQYNSICISSESLVRSFVPVLICAYVFVWELKQIVCIYAFCCVLFIQWARLVFGCAVNCVVCFRSFCFEFQFFDVAFNRVLWSVVLFFLNEYLCIVSMQQRYSWSRTKTVSSSQFSASL